MAQLRKILLVDDDDDLREALSEQLVMTEDFDVFEGRTGAEGMEKAKAAIYDLVILDVGLPDTDGRSCAPMNSRKTRCSSLGPTASVRRKSFWWMRRTRRSA